MTAIETHRLFSLDILSAGQDEALDLLLDGSEPKTAAFVNAHCINVAAKSPEYRWALGRADHVLPDGSGVSVAARLTGRRFKENLNGTDLFLPLCRQAAERGMSVFLLGSQEGVAEKAARKALECVPGLRVAGTRHGFFEDGETGAVIEQINRTGADIVLVALGVPKQDVWIARNRHRLNAKLVMGVGAQFDFWSGRVSRAPSFLRRLGGEWMWRLAIEPRRMAGRYLVGNLTFLGRALAEATRNRRETASGNWRHRALDVAVAGSAMAALSPLFLAVWLAVKLTSPGPVLFRQTRVGQNGKTFEVLKFRTMYVDAEARRAEVLKLTDRKGVCFKARNDPRITRVGRILRRYSIDELPQLINILRGEMSVVGPRPALPAEVEAYPAAALGRLATRPGLTGIWQVAGRAEIGFDKMIEMDLAYVRSKSVFLDLAIMLLTARAVLGGRGAY